MSLPKTRKHHKSLISLLESLKSIDVGAEIGVWRGHTSWAILQNFPEITELIGVDHYPKDHFTKTFDGKTIEDRKQEMLDLLKDKQAYQWINLPSLRAAELYKNSYFDFVFIDGDHSFTATDADVRAWWPKVKSGGVLCGHDYDGQGDRMRRNPFGVKRAVDAFALGQELEVGVYPSTIWAIRKP